MNAHILLIAADPHLSQLVELELLDSPEDPVDFTQTNQYRYSLSVAHNGIEGLITARESQPDLILLGINLPDCSGVEICRRLRSTGNQVPLILLSTEDKILDCVAGLDAGANDYIVQPFAMEELRARMRARLRRVALEAEPSRLQFEDLTLDRVTRDVYRRRQAIELTAKEFTLLEYFMAHPRQVMTREQILNHVWNDNPDIDSNVLDVYVRYLRLKLEQHHKQRLIHTVRGVGYALREPSLKKGSPVRLAGLATHSSRLAG
ncbi:response regulator transcription factor [Phormidium tenue FACHB-886]|nr:response regulator transcription factor [Phormidium tenue FACHB-886]